MLSKVYNAMGTTVAVMLVAVGVWAWRCAPAMGSRFDGNPVAAQWAIRCAGVAALAAAQVLGLTFLVGAFYGRNRSGDVMRLLAGCVCTAALIGSVAMAIVVSK
ncbi:MAG TPA: hypothetical protein VH518_04570 [Tepidisphaeraceae bacterium]|jgi:hypothetical protein